MLHERKVVVDLIQLTLNHGLFVVRAARDLAQANAILAEWQPHMAVIDMDHEDSSGPAKRLTWSSGLRWASRWTDSPMTS